MGYLEDIKRGGKFLEVAKQVVEKKPVIMIKSGRSKAGRKAASSHTGALAGADEAYEIAFKQTGVIRADTITEAFEMVRGFSSQNLPGGEKVLLVTNAGGAGIMATDACEDYSIKLASLTKDTEDKLKNILPLESSFSNPLDILGDAPPERFKATLKAVFPDPGIDAILIIVTPQTTTKPRETSFAVKDVCQGQEKPILSCFMGGGMVSKAISILNKANIPNYKDPEAAIKVLRNMIDHNSSQKRRPEEKVKSFSVNTSTINSLLNKEREKGYPEIGGAKALEIMKKYGIPTVDNFLAKNAKQAVQLADKIALPVVMKIESSAIIHKSDIGGVKVGLRGEQEITQSFQDIMESAKKEGHTEDEIEGISIQPMAKKGREILIGALKDKTFGHLIRFGLGGKYVELFRDFATRLAPLSDKKVESMIEETKIASKFLRGFRDEPPYDVDLVKESLLRLSQLVQDIPWIKEIEANPFVVWEKGGVIIDARIKIE